MRRAGALGFFVTLLVGAVVWVAPWAREMRPATAAVPSPHALDAVTPVPVAPRARACMPSVGLDSRATVLQLQTVAQAPPRPRLRVTLRGAGYARAIAVPGSAGSDVVLNLGFPAPGRDRLVTVCVQNAGRTPVALAASADRTRSRSVAVVDGRVTDASPWITFYEAGPRRLPGRAGEILSRMATFRPGFVVPAGLGLLALLLLAALTAGVGAAWTMACGARPADDAPPPVEEPAS